MRVGYHTQEYRPKDDVLEAPIKCVTKAWLGIGYYFWTDIIFAHYWGEDYKKGYKPYPGYYAIYKADIDTSHFMDTVFNEEGYLFYHDAIEEAFLELEKSRKSINLDSVNRYLKDKYWGEMGITGIIYDDKPINRYEKDREYSRIPNFYFKKRIQMVSFELDNVHNFAIHLDEQS